MRSSSPFPRHGRRSIPFRQRRRGRVFVSDIAASPDLDSFLQTRSTPLACSTPPSRPLLIWCHCWWNTEPGGGCDTLEVKSYEDPVFTGVVQVGTTAAPKG